MNMAPLRLLLLESASHFPSNPLFLDGAEHDAARGLLAIKFIDEAKWFSIDTLFDKVAYRALLRTPRTFWSYNRHVLLTARAFRPQVLLVTKGMFLSPETLSQIKAETGAVLVNYATDDPFNELTTSRFVKRSISLFDLYVTTKQAVTEDLHRAGARVVRYLPFGYKPRVHFPITPTEDDYRKYGSDVAFIGGADAHRAGYFRHLIRALPSVRLRLYGGRWREYPDLAAFNCGEVYGDDFRRVMCTTKIAVNLVRMSNRDDHVMRTFEAPATGAFMLSQRTDTQMALLPDETHAAYFETPDDFVVKVRRYLSDDAARQSIALAGHKAITTGGHTYHHRLAEILREAAPLVPRSAETASRS